MSFLFIIISFFVLFERTNTVSQGYKCNGNPSVCGKEFVCFRNSDSWYGCHKTCPDGWGCNNGKILCTKPVEDMRKEVAKLKNDERVNGFAINQLCIAEKACKNKRKLNNPSWIDNVINTFVEPYVQKRGEWNDIIAQCRELKDPWYDPFGVIKPAKYECQALMAGYHIPVDLQNAVNKHGCGTQHDWDLIGQYIKECVAEADMHIFAEWYAKYQVIKQRGVVRDNCLAYRELQGLQVEF